MGVEALSRHEKFFVKQPQEVFVVRSGGGFCRLFRNVALQHQPQPTSDSSCGSFEPTLRVSSLSVSLAVHNWTSFKTLCAGRYFLFVVSPGTALLQLEFA